MPALNRRGVSRTIMTTDFAAARLNMVESQVRPSDVTDVRIHDAMRSLARETFMPAGKAHLAYADASVEYAPGRALMQPRDVAKLIQVLKPRDGDKVLAIAAPYAAAVLEHMGLSVTSLDGDDLTAVSGGPYDVILTEGAVSEAPASWLAALAVGGRLGLVERNGPVGKACVHIRSAHDIGRRTEFDSTPPMLGGFQKQPGFAF